MIEKRIKQGELIECRFCGGKFSRITNTHLVQKHNISMKEYKEKFPGSPIDREGLADNRVRHLKNKSYIEVYGEEKGQDLKLKRKISAKKQFEDPNQRELRRHTIRPPVKPMSKKRRKEISKRQTRHGASNYRERALKHYGLRCQKCEKEFSEKKLVVHHKDFNNINYELGNHKINNLMVLCTICYRKLHFEVSNTTRKWIGLSHIERGVHEIFKGLRDEYGLNLGDINFKDTPKRVARAFAEIFEGIRNTDEQVKEILNRSFPSNGDEMIVVKDIRCYSMCPHHLLPVEYKIHVGYIPNGKVLGISKLARLADILAKRPVLQETFTIDIVNALEKLGVQGAMCMVEGIHYCMRMRGVRMADATTHTSAIYGVFKEVAARAEFISMIKG